jgi:nucleoid-associated protein YgaU
MRPELKWGIVLTFVLVTIMGVYFLPSKPKKQAISLGTTPATEDAARGDRAQDRSGADSRPSGTERRPTPNAARPSTDPAGNAPSDGTRALAEGAPTTETARAPGASESSTNPQAPTGGAPDPTRLTASQPPAAPPTAGPGGNPLPATNAGSTPALPGRDPAGAQRNERHIAQIGDTIDSIAQAYYGSDRYTGLLVQANPHLRGATHIRAGTMISIPPAPAGALPALEHRAGMGADREKPNRASTAGSTSGKPGDRTYVVKAGDTFYDIAREVLGSASRWKELFELNRDLVHGDPKRLRAGQVLTLPAASVPAP